MKERIVVTGASGHIGYHVASQLIALEHPVTLLTRTENRNIQDLRSKGARVILADLQHPESYRSALTGTEVLFHLAAENTTGTTGEESIISNTFGLSKKVFDTAIEEKVSTIIYTSSVVVLGRSPDPRRLLNENDVGTVQESPYVKGKYLTEKYCDELILKGKADIRRIYPSWVIGPHDPRLTPPHKVILDFFRKGQRFYFRGGISVASVEQVAKAHINAWKIGRPNEKYIAAGNNVSFKEFYTLLAALSGKKEPAFFIPRWIILAGAFLAEKILGDKTPLPFAYAKAVIGSYSWYDSSKTIRELGYSIPPLKDILRNAISEAKKRENGLRDLFPRHATLHRKEYAPDDVLLITGFPGWLGNRMVDILMNGDRYGKNAVRRRIRLLVQPGFNELPDLPSDFEIAYADLRDKAALLRALKDVKAVYHLAGVIYPKTIRTFREVNEEGTKNMVDACIACGIRRMLFMSTDSICGFSPEKRMFSPDEAPRPYKNYGRSKYLAEKYLLDKTKEGLMDGTSLRGFWFFGPFMPERNKGFFRMFYWKRQIVFGNGRNLRSISHVDNVIQAFFLAEKNPRSYGKWYWIGNKAGDYSVNNIYRNIAEGLGVTYKPLYIPNWICGLFSIFDTLISWSGRINATIHAAGKFHKNIAGDISAAEQDLNYKAEIGFEEIKKELITIIKD